MKKLICLLQMGVVFFFLAPTLGFAQDGSSNPPANSGGPGSTTATGTGVANAAAAVNQNYYGSDSRQLTQASAGTSSSGAYPGWGQANGQWGFYCPKDSRVFTMEEINNMTKGVKKPKDMHSSIRHPGVPNDSPIKLVCWWPENVKMYDSDVTLGHVTITELPFYPHDAAIAYLLKEAKQKTGALRVAIRGRVLNWTDTKGKNFGIGGNISGTTGTNVGGSVAAGFDISDVLVKTEDPYEFEVIILNDGEPDPPAPPAEKSKPPADKEQTTKVEPPSVPSQPQQTPKEPEVTKAPQPPAPPVALVSAPAPDQCHLEDFVIDFVIDKYEVRAQYLAKIKHEATWLKEHPTCKVQVEGHASFEASFNYNAGLSRSRALAVAKLLFADGAPKESILQFVSLSKDFPADKYNPEANRRVILRIVGEASGR